VNQVCVPKIVATNNSARQCWYQKSNSARGVFYIWWTRISSLFYTLILSPVLKSWAKGLADRMILARSSTCVSHPPL